MSKILVVEPDRVMAEVVTFTLQRAAFEVIQAHDGKRALERWALDKPHLIILEANLPTVDGFTVCKTIRQSESSQLGLIFLTARSEEDDIVRGLQWADDYICKPFSPRLLLARAEAVLRRVRTTVPQTSRQVGHLLLDLSRRQVCTGGSPKALTRLECRLLDYLMLNVGHILRTDALIDYVWEAEGADRDMLRQLIHRLRSKIEPEPTKPIYIETIAGLGYGLKML